MFVESEVLSTCEKALEGQAGTYGEGGVAAEGLFTGDGDTLVRSDICCCLSC